MVWVLRQRGVSLRHLSDCMVLMAVLCIAPNVVLEPQQRSADCEDRRSESISESIEQVVVILTAYSFWSMSLCLRH